MNVNKMNAYAARRMMELRGTMTSDNPYHAQHIREFCDYADAVAKSEADEVREEVPAIVQ